MPSETPKENVCLVTLKEDICLHLRGDQHTVDPFQWSNLIVGSWLQDDIIHQDFKNLYLLAFNNKKNIFYRLILPYSLHIHKSNVLSTLIIPNVP